MSADPREAARGDALAAAREKARQAFDSFRPRGMMVYGGLYQKVLAACEAYAAALGAVPAVPAPTEDAPQPLPDGYDLGPIIDEWTAPRGEEVERIVDLVIDEMGASLNRETRDYLLARVSARLERKEEPHD